MDRIKGDQRILGNSSFVLSILEQTDQRQNRAEELKQRGVDPEKIADKVGKIYQIKPVEIFMKSRIKRLADARGLYCYWVVNELGISLSELAEILKMTPAGVDYAVQRGESIAHNNGYDLLE
jgi:chromosomal replication initiation ATPase DnaA